MPPTEVSRLASPPSLATAQISSAYKKAILSWLSAGLRNNRGAALHAEGAKRNPATKHNPAQTNPWRSMSIPRGKILGKNTAKLYTEADGVPPKFRTNPTPAMAHGRLLP